MDKHSITKHWYACAYEQFETQPNDVNFLLKILHEQTDGTTQNILETACGGGRISVPLAQAGHKVAAFDCDDMVGFFCGHGVWENAWGIQGLRHVFSPMHSNGF